MQPTEPRIRSHLLSLIIQNTIIGLVSAALAILFLSDFPIMIAPYIALAAFSIVTAIGLYRRHPAAHTAAAYTPYLSLIIWFVFAYVIAGIACCAFTPMEARSGGIQVPFVVAVVVPVMFLMWRSMKNHYFEAHSSTKQLFD